MTGYFTLFLPLGIVLVGALELKCPEPQAIIPCTCHLKTKQIRCESPKEAELNETRLHDIGNLIDGAWSYLYIHGTKLKTIKKDTFKSSFDRIFIHSNDELASIESGAFSSTTHPVTLSIIKNKNLGDEENLFNVIRSMGKNLETLELNLNGITKIPKNALSGTGPDSVFPKLAYIRLDEQQGTKLKTIGNKAFANLPSLTQLSLDKNDITTIETDGIDLGQTTGAATKHVLIFLDHNKLNEAMLSPANIKYEKREWALKLILENNEITALKEGLVELIKEIASIDGNAVFLGNNEKMSCKCNEIKNILSVINDPGKKLNNNIRGIEKLNCDVASPNPGTPIKNC